MRIRRNERGAISVGLIVGILLVLFAVYEGKQFGPIIMSQYQFQDAAIEASKFSAQKDANSVASELLAKAAELQLPITRDMIKVTKQATYTRVQVTYDLTAEWLPGKPYTWTVTVDEESKIF